MADIGSSDTRDRRVPNRRRPGAGNGSQNHAFYVGPFPYILPARILHLCLDLCADRIDGDLNAGRQPVCVSANPDHACGVLFLFCGCQGSEFDTFRFGFDGAVPGSNYYAASDPWPDAPALADRISQSARYHYERGACVGFRQGLSRWDAQVRKAGYDPGSMEMAQARIDE